MHLRDGEGKLMFCRYNRFLKLSRRGHESLYSGLSASGQRLITPAMISSGVRVSATRSHTM